MSEGPFSHDVTNVEQHDVILYHKARHLQNVIIQNSSYVLWTILRKIVVKYQNILNKTL